MGGGSPDVNGAEFVGVKNAEDARQKVRRVAEAGLDWIALHDAQQFLPGELEAIVGAAKQSGIRLMGGANDQKELDALLGQRIDTIDYIDNSSEGRYSVDLLDRLKKKSGITLVPTVGYHYRIHAFDREPSLIEASSNYEFLSAPERSFVLSKAKEELRTNGYVKKSRDTYPSIGRKFRQLLATGIPIAMGTDVGTAGQFHVGAIWWELESWRAFGVQPRDALAAATVTAARVLREDRVGSLSSGSYGDFVLYSGNVEKGRFDVGRIRAVGKGGVLFVNDRRWVGP